MRVNVMKELANAYETAVTLGIVIYGPAHDEVKDLKKKAKESRKKFNELSGGYRFRM